MKIKEIIDQVEKLINDNSDLKFNIEEPSDSAVEAFFYKTARRLINAKKRVFIWIQRIFRLCDCAP